ncbi:hypothetical protein O3M35_009508 [Rhynocoris fuscipes]|uniref:Uncharacterized protein n=1 Tax=Rhynocoris fuscipes TaxID=488301 RepID=A0AAW1D6Q4_9HEMI
MIKLTFDCEICLVRDLLNIKVQLNTFRNERIRTLNVFCASDEVAPLLSRCRPKTNQV